MRDAAFLVFYKQAVHQAAVSVEHGLADEIDSVLLRVDGGVVQASSEVDGGDLLVEERLVIRAGSAY